MKKYFIINYKNFSTYQENLCDKSSIRKLLSKIANDFNMFFGKECLSDEEYLSDEILRYKLGNVDSDELSYMEKLIKTFLPYCTVQIFLVNRPAN